MGHLTQLAIILWKNLYVQKLKRHYLLTAAEVLMAALCFVGIEGDRPIIPRPNGTEPPYLAPFLVYNATTAADVHKPKVLLYSPNGVATVKTLVESAFQGYPSVQLMGYPNEDALMNAFRKEAPIPERGPDQTVITLQVEVSLAPANLQYIVGFYDNGDFVSRRYKNYPIFDPLPDAVTQRETVTLCQMALGSAYLNMVRTSRKYANASLYDVVSHRIPQGPHPWDTESRRYILAIRLGAAFLLPFCVFVGKMVRETETGIKERLCMIGMHDCAYWTAQFITSMVVGTVASALVVAYMSCYPLTGHGVSQTFLDDTSKTVVSFCFLLFCVQYTAVAMAMSLFYTNHVAAVAFASFFWMTASFVPCMVLEDWSGWSAYYLTLHRYTKLLSSLLPCMAVHWCFRIIGCANLVGEQYGWNCIGHYVLDLDNITMAEIWVCMTAGTIVSLVMVWYLSNVLPWARGVPRPFWFFLSSRYWLPAHMGTYVEAESQRPDDVYFEEGPSDTKPAVILDGLGLEKQQSYILHDMNFKAYFGEITVVLGPKGAGKTQLVSLIAGLVKPTRGRVIVNGFDMASETRSARRELGLCVNPDILFDDLTGYETLVLFGIMKDISRDILYVRITEVQDALGISPVMSTRLTSEMSRSQRRLLTIAGAILVGSGIIVLDEPAAGLDAYGRTTLWSTLTKMKHSGPTCIIIATADALETENICDRIAILGYGALKCHGSRAFVRRRFGCGLNVRLEKMHTGFATGAIIDIVQMHVPDVVVVSNSKEAMVLGMGEQKDLRVMAVAVQMLERDRGSLGIFSVTVFSDTMEDIMIRLVIDLVPKPVRVRGRESSFRHQSIVSRPSQTTLADYTGGSTTPVNVPAMHIEGLTALQGPCEPEVDVRVHVKELWNLKPAHPTTTQVFWALLAKRVFYTRQTWGLPLFCWFVPTAVVFFMCHLETTLHLRRNPMTLTSLSPDTLVYSLRDMYPSSNVFMAHDKLAEPLAHPLYQTLVVENAGLIASIDKLDAFLLHLAERRTLGIAEEDFLLGAHFTAGGRSKRHAVAYYNGDTYHTQNSKEGAAALLTGLRFCCAEFYKNNMTHLSTLGYLSFHRDSAGTELLVMIIEGALFMLLLVTYEGGVYRPLVGFRSEGTPSGQPPQDVADERRIVEKATAQRDFSNAALYVHNLQKRIGQRTKVRGVSFHVKPGECLVIFGLRHSGKSTLINLLSGVQEATAGTANMPDVALTDLEDWHQRIGVCPDYDGNLGSLTVHQTLWVYAKIRGIESGRVEELVSHVVNLLNLRNYDTWYVKDCDASVRRRLAVGVAVVGLPPVVLMDDPAFGLDAVSRQNIYDTIRLIRELATSAVVIATSSMSDCKLMSDRMALMVDGQFQSIGTEKDVLKRLCQGCQLRLRFLPFQAENAVFMVYVNRRVRHWFPGAVLISCVQGTILEYLVEVTTSWGSLLSSLQDLKTLLNPQEIHIGEATFEHAMLRAMR
ncbi:phospholipid-transporting ATPase ABCA3-like isoform X3 [Ornithodoros turicata]|uniref:phospholipid-transporting ATPase ABCA3-like isoform X3 n=1 Tax=Ornithodoros turicata TaxID=34597 RepID=UPI0031391676